MTNAIRFILIFFSAITIIVADALLKKISTTQSFINILKDPWMIIVYILYVIQIFLAAYVFILKGELAIYTNLFIVFYGMFGVIIGVWFFKESINTVQMIGIYLGLLGTVLMNYR